MSLYEALKGARVELAAIPSPAAKLRRLAGITQTFCVEILQQFLVLPYALRAISTYRSLPRLQHASSRPSANVALLQGVSYGPKQRNVLDVYLPPAGPASAQDGSAAAAPVALFCHGGVWAAGDKWHYAPMATRLAGAGVLTLVMHYTLYPDALVPEMADEVSLVGHSAGAQLAMLALLGRVRHSAQGQQQQLAAAQQPSSEGWRQDGRMPKRLVGMAGVYDLTKHFGYEALRGVAELSTMKRAVGGAQALASVSPVVILAHALAAEAKHLTADGPTSTGVSDKQPALRGEALSHRIGFERPCGNMAGRLARVLEPHGNAVAGPRLTADEARRLPPMVLMSSCADVVVPWYESAEMFWMLHDCGVPCKHLVDPAAGHGDYVVTWKARPQQAGSGTQAATQKISAADTGNDLPDVARDLLLLVSEQVELAWR